MRNWPIRNHHPGSIAGFTLIELIAVISIISLMLFFSIPRLENNRETGDINSVSRWVMINVQSLKERSVTEQKQFTLLVSFGQNSLSVMDEVSDLEIERKPMKEYLLPEDIRITDVEFPGKGVVSSGTAEIHFYPKGYSDKALLHLRDDAGVYSLLIEPFLPTVKLIEDAISLF